MGSLVMIDFGVGPADTLVHCIANGTSFNVLGGTFATPDEVLFWMSVSKRVGTSASDVLAESVNIVDMKITVWRLANDSAALELCTIFQKERCHTGAREFGIVYDVDEGRYKLLLCVNHGSITELPPRTSGRMWDTILS